MAKPNKQDPATLAREEGIALINKEPIFSALLRMVYINVDDNFKYSANKGWKGWFIVSRGSICLHAERRATAAQWARMIAIALVSLGFDQLKEKQPQRLWNIAGLLYANRFCDDLKIGQWPEELLYNPPPLPTGGIEYLFHRFVTEGCEDALLSWYEDLCGGVDCYDVTSETRRYYQNTPINWKDLLAQGIARGVDTALAKVVDQVDEKGQVIPLTRGQKAKQQLIDHYPLLGALAAGFELVEDMKQCQLHDIGVAAINVSAQKIWLNPLVELTANEALFVIAHELLHAGLNHSSRRKGRDPQLWNVACDFTINHWLIEMAVGSPPVLGLLYDNELANLAAEEIYDKLATDIRRARRLVTMRGNTSPDLLGDETGSIFTNAEEYCRRALMQGLDSCLYRQHRGTIPAGLVEEIRSLSQPPIPWDVKLAEWFDAQFPPLEKNRTYAKPSRRQASTPNIPRPSIAKPSEESCSSRVFGVVLDTSGSMDLQLLGKALGAIASYSLARDVFAVRLICCDAGAYDSGWVIPEALLHSFSVTGRGGTILQPGVDLLESLAKKGDFPIQGPVLVITDGYCEDNLYVNMPHAFLVPESAKLPFNARGEVFRVS